MIGAVSGVQWPWKAIEHQTQHLSIAKEVGDRTGEGQANVNLGTCHMHVNKYIKAVVYFEAQHVLATFSITASVCNNVDVTHLPGVGNRWARTR
jgi:hypothetical protein